MIDEPLLRLTSVDLGATADITNLAEVFDFAKDYLGLLKAAVIASGIVPPGIEGSGQSLADLLARVVGPGRGLELVSNVNDIPKGSRLAVSTNLLASLIALCMRATGQAASLTGPLQEDERRLVLARAMLGEWLGGSGGGWQDSGGVWPGMKLIEGVAGRRRRSRVRHQPRPLMPQHRILDATDAPPETRQKLQDSLVLVHGGMAQNVGPILEMVTEKYLLRSEAEWQARQSMLGILDEILAALAPRGRARASAAPPRAISSARSRPSFPGPPTSSPKRSSSRVQAEFGKDFWGFWMLGGMSGGGMGFIFDAGPQSGAARRASRRSCRRPSANWSTPCRSPWNRSSMISPSTNGAPGPTCCTARPALLPQGYYALIMPQLLRQEARALSPLRRAELDKFGAACRTKPELRGMVQTLVRPPAAAPEDGRAPARQSLAALLRALRLRPRPARADPRRPESRPHRPGAEPSPGQHADSGRGKPDDVFDADPGSLPDELPSRPVWRRSRAGEVAVVTLAAGAGSRWTQGAGVVKALHPFCKLGGQHRTFIEVHLAKSRRIGKLCRHSPAPHHHHQLSDPRADRRISASAKNSTATTARCSCPRPRRRPAADSHGARPAVLWEEMPQQLLDEQAQKVRDSLRTRSSTGRGKPAKAAITPTTCRCNACIRSATGTRFRICSATASWHSC